MNPFKPGDKVIYIDDGGGFARAKHTLLTMYQTYTVDSVSDEFVRLTISPSSGWRHSRFLLADNNNNNNNKMNLTVTKERVLEAAEKCSQAKATLKTLFPEAFKPAYPLHVGDIYKHPTGVCSNMLLLNTTYCSDAYILVGYVPDLVFSDSFHEAGPQPLAKIEEYLTKNNMVFSHNVKSEIQKLIG